MFDTAWLTELQAWFATLTPDFIFLLVLPFAVAAAGLLRESVDAARRAPQAGPAPREERRSRPHAGGGRRREPAH